MPVSNKLSIALAQINPIVGDVSGNIKRILTARTQAISADLVLVPELALSGYPPEDLILKDAFLDIISKAINTLALATYNDRGSALIVGTPWRIKERRYNVALLLDNGQITSIVFKHYLPNYGVFDEARIFTSGPKPKPVLFRGFYLGLMLCEDMWHKDIATTLYRDGAEILIALNSSPFELDKLKNRHKHASNRVRETGLPIIYLNQICGQDDLVFDGASFILNNSGQLIHQLPSWKESVVITKWTRNKSKALSCTSNKLTPQPNRLEGIYQALMLGLRDYVTKNHFNGVLIGLSGGVDSALSTAIAVDALGSNQVWCIMMPSPYTSHESLNDAKIISKLCNVRLDNISINPAMNAFGCMLKNVFSNKSTINSITKENIQARARGISLMAISNEFEYMVLATGNKSELSVGYSTLYGDMCGGYSVLKDIYKTTVFDMARWRNTYHPLGALGPKGAVMPESVISKSPSAELKSNQKDQDTLPSYNQLDSILHCFIEHDMGPNEVIAIGYDAMMVRSIFQMLCKSEYKRRQAPLGVKITNRAFGRDRRYPSVNGFINTD